MTGLRRRRGSLFFQELLDNCYGAKFQSNTFIGNASTTDITQHRNDRNCGCGREGRWIDTKQKEKRKRCLIFEKKQTKQTQFFGFRLKTEREESIIFYTRGIENILEIEIVESLIIFLERLFIKERKKPMFFFWVFWILMMSFVVVQFVVWHWIDSNGFIARY